MEKRNIMTLLHRILTSKRLQRNKYTQCNYASLSAGVLRAHLKIHSGENSNKCKPCIVSGRLFETTFENAQWSATSVTLHPLKHVVWRDIWKHTEEKGQTNATNVTIVTLVAFVWPFSSVCFQMSLQTTCLSGCKVTLVALHCAFSNVVSNSLPETMHGLHLFEFSPLCIFKCALKTPALKDA